MKKLVTGICFFLASYNLAAQDINSIFASVPEEVIFGLEAAQKDMLLSNPQDTAQISVIRNIGEAKRTAISSDYIAIKTSDAGTVQIKLLPLINDSKIICVVKTVCSKICDSQIKFYTTQWIPIDKSELIPKIDKKWFLKEGIDESNQEIENILSVLDLTPIKMTLSTKNNSLTLEYDIKNYLSKEDFKKVEPYLKDEPKILEWDKVLYK